MTDWSVRFQAESAAGGLGAGLGAGTPLAIGQTGLKTGVFRDLRISAEMGQAPGRRAEQS